MLMRTWCLVSNYSKKNQIYIRQCIKYDEINIYKKLFSQRVLGFNLSEDIPNLTNRYISESNMRCEICIR